MFLSMMAGLRYRSPIKHVGIWVCLLLQTRYRSTSALSASSGFNFGVSLNAIQQVSDVIE